MVDATQSAVSACIPRSSQSGSVTPLSADIYSHGMPGMQEEAAEKIDAGLRKALAG
jgi:hypothetical protein